jgi:hypothetical protein
MRLTRYGELDWETRPSMGNDGRPKDKKTRFKLLQKGTPGEPVHYEMVVTTYPAIKSVKRHRHDTDQYRYTLKGTSPWAPGFETAEGSLLFIPAGTLYGPYERPAGIELLQVEFEGAGRSPFVDFETLHEAHQRLAERGTFGDDGYYTEVTASGETRRLRGGKARLMEAWGGREYPPPTMRYSLPIEINPRNFAWTGIAPGVQVKELLSFPERGTRTAELGLGAGATYEFSADQTTLLFVSTGTGTAGGEAIEERDSVRVDPGERLPLAATSRLEFLVLGLPKVDAKVVGANAGS